jgi:hypothetical protein
LQQQQHAQLIKGLRPITNPLPRSHGLTFADLSFTVDFAIPDRPRLRLSLAPGHPFIALYSEFAATIQDVIDDQVRVPRCEAVLVLTAFGGSCVALPWCSKTCTDSRRCYWATTPN